MNLAFVGQVKNINVVVELYKKNKNIPKIITTKEIKIYFL